MRVYGVGVDSETRCAHYGSPLDVIAIRFPCCGRFYPCHECHVAVTDHAPCVWPADRFDEPAVLCGVCGHQMTVTEYLASAHTCPACAAAFNPGCVSHRHLYFAS